MIQSQLDAILLLPISEQIEALSVSSFDIPTWSDLKKQYDPNLHAIKKDLTRYPVIPNDKGGDDMKRITRALQKLACNRMAQTMFSTPIDLTFSYNEEIEAEKKAVDIITELYRTQNFIDAENIERAKKNNASCQIATVWRVYEKPNIVKGETSKFKLSHTTYSEMDGYKIYANIDNNRNILVISFSYSDSNDVEYFDIYTNGASPQFISYYKDGDWKLVEEPKKLLFFPVSYTYLNEPVWGGDSGTTQVETIEETVSYRAMYIKKNSVPLATIDMGDTDGMERKPTTDDGGESETDEDKTRVIATGKGGSIKYVVWDVNNGTSENQVKDMGNAFFEDNQIPNISFANLLDSRTSADNKDIMLTDSKGKAIDLGGEWEMLFNTELNDIIIPFAKIMFPSISTALDSISVRAKIKPFNIKSDLENSQIVANASAAMSLETKVRVMNKVEDVSAEVARIEDENTNTL